MTPEILRPPTSTEPHLSEMSAAAITTLDRLNDRFFVMIEGGVIDLVKHVENLDALVPESRLLTIRSGSCSIGSTPAKRRSSTRC